MRRGYGKDRTDRHEKYHSQNLRFDATIKKTNSYDFVIYKEYTQALIQEFDSKTCEFKVSFCFNPNTGIPTDMMKSRVQAGLIEEYKKMMKEAAAAKTATTA